MGNSQKQRASGRTGGIRVFRMRKPLIRKHAEDPAAGLYPKIDSEHLARADPSVGKQVSSSSPNYPEGDGQVEPIPNTDASATSSIIPQSDVDKRKKDQCSCQNCSPRVESFVGTHEEQVKAGGASVSNSKVNGRFTASEALQEGEISQDTTSADGSGGTTTEATTATTTSPPSISAFSSTPFPPASLNTPVSTCNSVASANKSASVSNGEDSSKNKPNSASANSPVKVEESEKFALLRSNFIIEHSRLLNEDYTIDKKLGSGSYGSVSRVIKKSNGIPHAIKEIAKGRLPSFDKLRREVNIMKSLDHPNIVKLFETYEDSKNFYLVLELCTGGELFDRIVEVGHFDERSAARIMLQIFSAINYLHKKNIMHRDIKPENFLFYRKSSESALKLIDFGLSTYFQQGGYNVTKAGTPYYISPQILLGMYNEKCDCWAAGVIMYILLSGRPPFAGDNDAEVLSLIKVGEYSFDAREWKDVSDDAKDLISNLLRFDPRKRISVKEALDHPWMHGPVNATEIVSLSSSLLENLQIFNAQGRLRKAAMTIIARSIVDKDIENLRNVFISLDTDRSGTLSMEELGRGVSRIVGEDCEDILQDFRKIDSDLSGTIDYTEFIAALFDKKLHIQRSVCREAFKVFDLDNDGKISSTELLRVLNMENVQNALGIEAAEKLIAEVDLNKDGEIDFAEFMQMMMQK